MPNTKFQASRHIRHFVGEALASFEEEILESGKFDYDEIVEMSPEALCLEFEEFLSDYRKSHLNTACAEPHK